MLVHICCAVDSHYFLQKLQKEYPDETLIGFFYDPNIHPYSEYYLRLLDVKRSCKMLGIKLLEGAYDTEAWFKAVEGLEKEPEKGVRCSVCFDRRFEVSAQKAAQLHEESFTSTLLTSPKKSIQQLQKVGDVLAKKYGLVFIAPDYRKASGTQEQNILAKESSLYRQDYCGCIFGLTMQREMQQKIADELFMPMSQQVQPESIEARIALYERRWKIEEEGISYKIVKQRFLNWRLHSGVLWVKKEVIPAHFLPYSTLKSGYTRGRVTYSYDGIAVMNRDEVKFITLTCYNQHMQQEYQNIKSLIFHPPMFEKEVALRSMLGFGAYDLCTIVVVEAIPQGKVEISLQSMTYLDVQEELKIV